MGRVCCQLDYRNIPTVSWKSPFLLEESVIRKTKHSLKRDSGESEEADFGGFIIPVSWFTVFPSEWVGLGFGFVLTSGRYSCICCAELLVLSVRFTKWVCFTTIAAHIPRGVAAEMVSLSCPVFWSTCPLQVLWQQPVQRVPTYQINTWISLQSLCNGKNPVFPKAELD